MATSGGGGRSNSVILDRFEGERAVLEFGREVFSVPRCLVPQEAVEGDVLTLAVTLDRDAGNRLEQETQELLDDIFGAEAEREREE